LGVMESIWCEELGSECQSTVGNCFGSKVLRVGEMKVQLEQLKRKRPETDDSRHNEIQVTAKCHSAQRMRRRSLPCCGSNRFLLPRHQPSVKVYTKRMRNLSPQYSLSANYAVDPGLDYGCVYSNKSTKIYGWALCI
jgi:hypothetical protein